MKGSKEINPFNSMERMIDEIFPKVYEINQPPQGGMNENRKHITRKSTKLAPSKYGMIEQ